MQHKVVLVSGAGGTIAFVKDCDAITIDAHKLVLVLVLNVPEAKIAKPCADWTAPRCTRAVKAKFAFNASTASKGAVLDDY